MCLAKVTHVFPYEDIPQDSGLQDPKSYLYVDKGWGARTVRISHICHGPWKEVEFVSLEIVDTESLAGRQRTLWELRIWNKT